MALLLYPHYNNQWVSCWKIPLVFQGQITPDLSTDNVAFRAFWQGYLVCLRGSFHFFMILRVETALDCLDYSGLPLPDS
jgi:hypothetical protein